MNNLFFKIFEVCIIPLLGVLTTWLVSYIQAKKTDVKQRLSQDTLSQTIDMLEKLVVDCVLATNQTYVEALKKAGKFDREAQVAAFNMTKSAVLQVLSTDAQALLEAAVGDFNIYLSQLIESKVNQA